ncbi:MAG: histidine phosphatase family protein [Candidatus Paceibacterota bacterium]|nr:histidine phosphatase family protein [Candidatus Paceibacterota bacterium]HPD55264.1 histidine phosphatase family protein [Candidatus Paceibacterota bacterium]HQM34903.1 histidine phosphatase family protein [Candidatus Paceibacterota bacterium]
MVKINNNYFLLRHGEAFSNREPRWLSSWPEIKIAHLTSRGKLKIKKQAQIFKTKGIDLIFSSDLARTKETAQIVAQIIKKPVIFKKELRELNFGVFNGFHPNVYWAYFQNPLERFTKKIPHGETLNQCAKRIFNFWKKINCRYQNKNILIISHADPLWLLESKIRKLTKIQMVKNYRLRLSPGEVRIIRAHSKD